MSLPRPRFILSILAAATLLTGQAKAAVSYFMLMGDFNETGTMQTYKWAVNYPSGSLLTGKDLIDAIFGVPVEGTGDDEGFFYASNGGFTFEYAYGGGFLNGVEHNGTWLYDDYFGTGSTWIQFASGGSYDYTYDGDLYNGPYPNGAWASGHGLSAQNLVDGSFTAFIYSTYGGFSLTGQSVTAAMFSGPDTIVINVPEPGKGMLILLAGAYLFIRRRR